MSDFDKLRTELRRQGFAVERTSRGHHRVTASDGKQTVFSDSEDHRALKNTISDLKKIGFEPEGKKNGNGNDQHYDFIACPLCKTNAFNSVTATCENMACSSHAAIDTDSLYLEVKAMRELVVKADEDVADKKFEVERATSALHVATEKQKQLKDTHERLKKQLIKALEE